MEWSIRTDLALESRECFTKEKGELRGVRFFEESVGKNIRISTVLIETEKAAKQLHRPRGHYITIEDTQMTEGDASQHRDLSRVLAQCVRALIRESKTSKTHPELFHIRDFVEKVDCASALVVGLGNRQVTPDALGPSVVDQLSITRHILREFGSYAYGTMGTCSVSAIVPGVMAQTGMECAEILKWIVEKTRPQVMVTVDALAARSIHRLSRTIQLSDTGITPGSGVGNHRHAIDASSMGIPVISIGVPTVVDAATIVHDAMEGEGTERIERISPQLNTMFVTSKNVDDEIRQLSFLIAEGLNQTFQV